MPAGCHGVTFVPDLRGRISPVPDPDGARRLVRPQRRQRPRRPLSRRARGPRLRGAADRRRPGRVARPGVRSREIRAIGGNTPQPPADADQGLGLRPADRRRRDGRGDRARRGAARRPRGRRLSEPAPMRSPGSRPTSRPSSRIATGSAATTPLPRGLPAGLRRATPAPPRRYRPARAPQSAPLRVRFPG